MHLVSKMDDRWQVSRKTLLKLVGFLVDVDTHDGREFKQIRLEEIGTTMPILIFKDDEGVTINLYFDEIMTLEVD